MENKCSLKVNNSLRKSKATLLSIFAPIITLAKSAVSAFDIIDLYIIFEKNT